MNFQRRRHRIGTWLFLGLIPFVLLLPGALLNAQSVNQGSTKSPVVAVAPPVVDNPRPDFARTDRNKDGFVDKSEAGVVPGLSALFERVDRNRDGKLDRDEFSRGLSVVGQK